MRSFIHWNIIERIADSPKQFIVHRNVGLLNAFLFGYEFIYLMLENESQLKEKYSRVPSLEEFAREKYQANNIGTRNFESLISYNCEDEREFFQRYLDFLREYEETYPIEETVQYILAPVPKISLGELIAAMGKRYPMYFGDNDLASFRCFLDGYFLCKSEYGLLLDELDLKVKAFTEGICCESVSICGSYVTWDRKYRYDRDWRAWGSADEKDMKSLIAAFWLDLKNYIDNEITSQK